MDGRPPFRVELMVPSERCAVVALEGELDIYTASQFKKILLRSIDDGAQRVIVDLSKVSFIDSSALGVMVGGAKRLRSANGSLDIVCRNENIRRIFEITGLERILNIYSTRQQALSDTKSG
jgi:anti-sigma B factor antagonist